MDKRLRAEDYEVCTISDHSQAVAFIECFHYSRSAPNTSTYRHGLYLREGLLLGELLGVALWIPPTRAAAETLTPNWESVLSLSRFAIHPDAPANAASFLLAASRRAIDRAKWPILLTYADTGEGHTGSIYKADNWECLGEVPAGDTWTFPDGKMRGRKRGGRTMTRSEMFAAGAIERPAKPKIKFVRREMSK